MSRLDAVTDSATKLMERYLFGEAGRQVNEFIWNETLRLVYRSEQGAQERERIRCNGTALAYTLERSLRLMHPFMPFITEALWQQLPQQGESIMVAAWPEAGERDIRCRTGIRGIDGPGDIGAQRPALRRA